MGVEIQNQNNNFQDSNIDIGQHFNNVQIANQVNNFTLSEYPIDKFIHYNFNDSYLLFINILLIAIPLCGLFYAERLNAYIMLLIFISLVLFYFYRLLNILKSLDVFPMYFRYNGKKIKFKDIKYIKKIGLYVKITYNKVVSDDWPKKITFTRETDLLKFIEIYNKSKN